MSCLSVNDNNNVGLLHELEFQDNYLNLVQLPNLSINWLLTIKRLDDRLEPIQLTSATEGY